MVSSTSVYFMHFKTLFRSPDTILFSCRLNCFTRWKFVYISCLFRIRMCAYTTYFVIREFHFKLIFWSLLLVPGTQVHACGLWLCRKHWTKLNERSENQLSFGSQNITENIDTKLFWENSSDAFSLFANIDVETGKCNSFYVQQFRITSHGLESCIKVECLDALEWL